MHFQNIINGILVALILTCFPVSRLTHRKFDFGVGGDPHNKWCYRAGWGGVILAAAAFFEGHGLLIPSILVFFSLLIFIIGFAHNQEARYNFHMFLRMELKGLYGHLTSQEISNLLKRLDTMPKQLTLQEAAHTLNVDPTCLRELFTNELYTEMFFRKGVSDFVYTPESFQLSRKRVVLFCLKKQVRDREARRIRLARVRVVKKNPVRVREYR